jgi:hypothetical protein
VPPRPSGSPSSPVRRRLGHHWGHLRRRERAGRSLRSRPLDAVLEEGEVIEAVGALEPVWDELYPAEQARILRLLIERIDVAPDGISVTLHAAGSRSLVAELASEGATAGVAPQAIMEAAE